VRNQRFDGAKKKSECESDLGLGLNHLFVADVMRRESNSPLRFRPRFHGKLINGFQWSRLNLIWITTKVIKVKICEIWPW
jgi:hypothetical protein